MGSDQLTALDSTGREAKSEKAQTRSGRINLKHVHSARARVSAPASLGPDTARRFRENSRTMTKTEMGKKKKKAREE
jgi:hypothetical protein